METPLVIPIYNSFWILSIISSSFVAKYLSRKWVILISSVIMNGAILTSYFLITRGFYVAFECIYAIFLGMAEGCLYGTTIQLVIEIADSDVGFLTSLLQSASNIGGILIVAVARLYINPDNKVPRLHIGSTNYFVQKDIINSIYSVFVVHFAFCLSCHLVGLILLQFNPTVAFCGQSNIKCGTETKEVEKPSIPNIANDERINKYNSFDDKSNGYSCTENNDSFYNGDNFPKCTSEECTTETNEIEKPSILNCADSERTNEYKSLNHKSNGFSCTKNNVCLYNDDKFPKCTVDGESTFLIHDSKSTSTKQTISSDFNYRDKSFNSSEKSIESSSDSKESLNEDNELSPKQAIRTARFWALGVSFCFADYAFLILGNYYKLFGQVYIHDDSFLTYTGICYIIIGIVSRIVWGIALDNLPTKPCLVTLLSSVVLTAVWYFFTPLVNRWLYFCATLFYGSFPGAIYVVFLAVATTIFGKTHAASNFGLLMILAIFTNAIFPFAINTLLTSLGWFGLFASAGAVALIGLILCLIVVPEC